MTGASKKAPKVILDQVPYMYYLVQFQKDKEATIWAVIDSGSKINTMTPVYANKLGLQTWKIDVRAQKIDESSLNIFGIVIAGFQVLDKQGRAWFF